MPKTLTGDIRELILKVREFFIKEKNNKGPIIPIHKVRERVAAATGVSQRTVTTIIQEGAVAQATGTKIPTPGKHRKTRKDKVVLDENDLSAIKRKIHEYEIEKNEKPSVRKLHQRLKEEADVKFTRAILRQLMKKITGNVSKTSPGKKNRPTAPSDRTPNSSSSKNAMMEWLTRHSIEFSPEYSKQQLLELVGTHSDKKPKKFDAGTSNSGTDAETSKPRFLIKQESETKPMATDFKDSHFDSKKHIGLLDPLGRPLNNSLPVKVCEGYPKEGVYADFGRTENLVTNEDILLVVNDFKRDT